MFPIPALGSTLGSPGEQSARLGNSRIVNGASVVSMRCIKASAACCCLVTRCFLAFFAFAIVPPYFTTTSSTRLVSTPKMSITFTMTWYLPAAGYSCSMLVYSSVGSLRVRKLCHSFSKR